MKRILCLVMVIFMMATLAGCSSAKPVKVKIEMEKGGVMVLELYPQYAPKTVENFVNLAEKKYFDGTVFHRIISDFMIQGGEGKETLTPIKGEFSQNGWSKNTLSHTRGVISMARTGEPDSATSQFFICTGDATFLDGQYAAFGKVIEGDDVLKQIANTPVVIDPDGIDKKASKPIEPPVIKSITVIK